MGFYYVDDYEGVEENDSEYVEHYGMPRRSGRYPWGSGKEPYQRSGDFLARVEQLRKENFKFTDEKGKTWTGDTAIAKGMGLETTQFRVQVTMAKNERRALDVARAKSLREDGKSLNEIADIMGFKNDSSVRSLLDPHAEERMKQARATADTLKKMVDEKGMIDVGVGVERELGVSRTKLEESLYMLEMEGYPTYGGGVPQVTNPGRQTNLKVLCPPGTEHKEIYQFDKINSATDYISYDGGETFKKGFEYPSSLDSKRLMIRYGDKGGIEKDGVIEVRRGCADLDLGKSTYAQARIMVDGTHYLKGMAVYGDNMPDGVDVIFNTNKPTGTPPLGPKNNSVLKPIKSDPNNPFGSLIKEHGGQSYYDDPNGKFVDPKTGKKQSLSLINKRAEEGDWGSWSDHLPSQFLSKQTLVLAKRQLGLSISDKQAEFEDICSLTNPTVKRAMLNDFAQGCDSAAVHLQAAALPRQKYQVILPLTSIKDTEVYAPNYENGEKVALVRYPHGGTFEIPILTVNNKIKEGKNVIGTAPLDAIGINHKVADRLSGADFDGDTVMVIPTNDRIKIASTRPLDGLKGFDPKLQYGGKPEGSFKPMKNTQNEMGQISNLITDMTLRGAKSDELAAAVRHSMVVIDAEKHRLDYKQSEIDNNIAGLKKKYQGDYDENGKYHEGAATLISRAKSQKEVEKRKGSPKINDPSKSWYDPSRPEGALLWNSVHEEYTGKDGKVHVRTQKSTKMAETDDARTLISKGDTPMEGVYAQYANTMKSFGNEARKEFMVTGRMKRDPEAAVKYKKEVQHLNDELILAERNAPKERQAQIMANSIVEAKKQADPELTTVRGKADLKKIKQQALTESRIKVGAQRHSIKITDSEWEAIQAGAISDTHLEKMLKYMDMDSLRDRAMPKSRTTLSPAKISKMESLKSSGHSVSEIAKALGVSTSTVSKYMNGERE